MWKELQRIIKPKKAIVLFGAEPFSSYLRMSNINNFKYDWIWIKSIALGFTNAKLKPLNNYEIISIFSEGTTANQSPRNMPYNPQGLIEINKIVDGTKNPGDSHKFHRNSYKKEHLQTHTNYPKRTLNFPNSNHGSLHPTQKPVAIIEYLIKTYSNENDIVLDFCMGSGTTAIAAINTNRKYIGFENNKEYYDLSLERIKTHEQQLKEPTKEVSYG